MAAGGAEVVQGAFLEAVVEGGDVGDELHVADGAALEGGVFEVGVAEDFEREGCVGDLDRERGIDCGGGLVGGDVSGAVGFRTGFIREPGRRRCDRGEASRLCGGDGFLAGRETRQAIVIRCELLDGHKGEFTSVCSTYSTYARLQCRHRFPHPMPQPGILWKLRLGSRRLWIGGGILLEIDCEDVNDANQH